MALSKQRPHLAIKVFQGNSGQSSPRPEFSLRRSWATDNLMVSKPRHGRLSYGDRLRRSFQDPTNQGFGPLVHAGVGVTVDAAYGQSITNGPIQSCLGQQRPVQITTTGNSPLVQN